MPCQWDSETAEGNSWMCESVHKLYDVTAVVVVGVKLATIGKSASASSAQNQVSWWVEMMPGKVSVG